MVTRACESSSVAFCLKRPSSDWFHIAMRFEHALRAAGGLGAETPNAWLGEQRRRDIEIAKWRLWNGRWKSCLVKLAEVRRWLRAGSIRNIAGARALRALLTIC